MKIEDLIMKIQRKWMKIRLQPIRVFCFHHVSGTYEPSYMWEEDWTQIDLFKRYIEKLRNLGYTFISLQEAQEKLTYDLFRGRRYAVLTADDGFRSVLNILSWLEEQQIPITLFVNPKYISEGGIGDNVQMRLEQTNGSITSDELYLNLDDIKNLTSPLISLAYHGYEHLDEWEMDKEAFLQNVKFCMEAMQNEFPSVTPYYAHTYGHFKPENDAVLRNLGITPVNVFGEKNFNNAKQIDRELISNERLVKGLLQ